MDPDWSAFKSAMQLAYSLRDWARSRWQSN